MPSKPLARNITPPKHVAAFLDQLDLLPLPQMLSLPAQQRVKHATAGMKMQLAGALYTGYALRSLKAELPHGEYMAATSEIGIPDRTARRYIQLVGLFEGLKSSKWPALADLELTKIYELMSWETAEIDQLCDGEEVNGVTLERAQELSTRQLSLAIKDAQEADVHKRLIKLEQEKNNLTARLQDKDNRIRELRRSRGETPAHSFPDFVTTTRAEANAAAEKVGLCLDDMTALQAELIRLWPLQRNDERLREYWHIAASAVYYQSRAMVAQATALLMRLEAELPESVTGELVGEYLYSEAEVRQVIADRNLIIQLHNHEKICRENGRHQARGRRGRPRKARV